MKQVFAVALVAGMFALGVLPGRALACDRTLAKTFGSRCNNALDANDWPAATVYCQQNAEQAGICPDEATGNARANDLAIKMDALSLTGRAYLEMGKSRQLLQFTDSADKVAHELLAMAGIRQVFKDQARQQLRCLP